MGLESCAPFMASEIFGTAAIFWVLIPIGLLGGALLLKLEGD
jgi:cytochrome b6-f complex subunit 7